MNAGITTTAPLSDASAEHLSGGQHRRWLEWRDYEANLAIFVGPLEEL